MDPARAVHVFGLRRGLDHVTGAAAKKQAALKACAQAGRTGSRFGINTMSAIGPRGKLYLTVFESSFTTQVFIAFLERLVGHFTATPPKSSWASCRRIHPI